MSQTTGKEVNQETLKFWIDTYRIAISISNQRLRQVEVQRVIEGAAKQGVEAGSLMGSIT